MWGYTYSKQYYTPELVPLWESYKVKKIGIGDQHLIALVRVSINNTSKSIILTWGKSSYGALGLGVFSPFLFHISGIFLIA